MYVSFNLLPPNAKVWIYQSDTNLSITDVELIEKEVVFFLNNWSSHNKEIESSYEIRYNRFLIIGLNENINSKMDYPKFMSMMQVLHKHLE